MEKQNNIDLWPIYKLRIKTEDESPEVATYKNKVFDSLQDASRY